MTNDMIYATSVLSLFKKLPETSPSSAKPRNEENVKRGFFITEDAAAKCALATSPELLSFIEDKYGYDAEAMNNGLHRSFKEVAESDISRLFAEQVVHYLSVFLQNGDMTDKSAIDNGMVYIPASELSLPEDSNPVKVLVIGSISEKEVFSRIASMLSSGIALSKETLDDIFAILKVRSLAGKLDVESVKNKEAKVRLYDLLGCVPDGAEDFLRFLVYKATGNSLVIRNRDLILGIKHSVGFDAEPYFRAFVAQNGENGAAEAISRVFLRHKNKAVFLAFRGSAFVNHVLNRARKLADKNKVAAKRGVLDRVTSDASLTVEDVRKALENVTVYKKVSVANSLLFRASNPKVAVYLVRNGKAFAMKKECDTVMDTRLLGILNAVLDSIADDVRPAVEGKRVFIPEGIEYAMPTSEKRFIGGVPFNSSVSLGKEAVVGIHWVDADGERTDLDLHYNSTKFEYGWDTQFSHDSYREKRLVIFSGDMTAAPKENGGATEAFWFGSGVEDDLGVIDLNNYTASWDGASHVSYKLVVGSGDPDQLSHDYLVNCHKAALNVQLAIDTAADSIGFLEADTEGEKTFWFAKSVLGNSIVSRYNQNRAAATEAMRTTFHSCLKLRDVLSRAGAVFEKGEDEEWDVDLSMDKVAKDTFLALLGGKKEKED